MSESLVRLRQAVPSSRPLTWLYRKSYIGETILKPLRLKHFADRGS